MGLQPLAFGAGRDQKLRAVEGLQQHRDEYREVERAVAVDAGEVTMLVSLITCRHSKYSLAYSSRFCSSCHVRSALSKLRDTRQVQLLLLRQYDLTAPPSRTCSASPLETYESLFRKRFCSHSGNVSGRNDIDGVAALVWLFHPHLPSATDQQSSRAAASTISVIRRNSCCLVRGTATVSCCATC